MIVPALLVAALAVAAQVRRRHLPPPAPLAQVVPVRACRAGGLVEVDVSGVPGVVLCLHDATWEPCARVHLVEGPRTLARTGDRRRYVLETGADRLELRHAWEQLRGCAVRLDVEVPAERAEVTPG